MHRRRSSGPRTVALVLHTASHSGPARNFASRFQGTGYRLHVYAPKPGPAPDMFRDFARIHIVPYGRVMTPRSLRSAGRAVRTLVRDVARFRTLFREAGVDTVVCATTVTPAAALAARSLRLTSVVYCGELFGGRLLSGARWPPGASRRRSHGSRTSSSAALTSWPRSSPRTAGREWCDSIRPSSAIGRGSNRPRLEGDSACPRAHLSS